MISLVSQPIAQLNTVIICGTVTLNPVVSASVTFCGHPPVISEESKFRQRVHGVTISTKGTYTKNKPRTKKQSSSSCGFFDDMGNEGSTWQDAYNFGGGGGYWDYGGGYGSGGGSFGNGGYGNSSSDDGFRRWSEGLWHVICLLSLGNTIFVAARSLRTEHC